MYKLIRIAMDKSAIQVKTWKTRPSKFQLNQFVQHWRSSLNCSYHMCLISLKQELLDSELIEEISKIINNDFIKMSNCKFNSIKFYSLKLISHKCK